MLKIDGELTNGNKAGIITVDNTILIGGKEFVQISQSAINLYNPGGLKW